MTDALEKPYFADVEGFILAVSGANLLSACGGPYPDRADVKVIESRKLAIDSIVDAMLDATPHHELGSVC